MNHNYLTRHHEGATLNFHHREIATAIVAIQSLPRSLRELAMTKSCCINIARVFQILIFIKFQVTGFIQRLLILQGFLVYPHPYPN